MRQLKVGRITWAIGGLIAMMMLAALVFFAAAGQIFNPKRPTQTPGPNKSQTLVSRLLTVTAIFTPTVTPSAVITVTATPRPEGACDETLWNYVYHPARLKVIQRCVTLTGKIDGVKAEPDGDFHIKLRLDGAYATFVNKANVLYQNGDLVVEAICLGKVTQTDAMAACSGFIPNVSIPVIGTRIKVTGAYVLDLDINHGWNEIHPVTKIEVLK